MKSKARPLSPARRGSARVVVPSQKSRALAELAEVRFIVNGETQPAARDLPKFGSVKGSVRLDAARERGESVELRAAPGTDVVVLEVRGGPTLVLHPDDARDLLRAQNPAATRDAGPARARTTSPCRPASAGPASRRTRPAVRRAAGWVRPR